MSGFTKGQRVTTPAGLGRVAYARMAPPAFERPAAISVVLDSEVGRPGYVGTVFPAELVAPTLAIAFWGTVRVPPFRGPYDLACRGKRAALVPLVEWREIEPKEDRGS